MESNIPGVVTPLRSIVWYRERCDLTSDAVRPTRRLHRASLFIRHFAHVIEGRELPPTANRDRPRKSGLDIAALESRVTA